MTIIIVIIIAVSIAVAVAADVAVVVVVLVRVYKNKTYERNKWILKHSHFDKCSPNCNLSAHGMWDSDVVELR